jgi:hypothetical protein
MAEKAIGTAEQQNINKPKRRSLLGERTNFRTLRTINPLRRFVLYMEHRFQLLLLLRKIKKI